MKNQNDMRAAFVTNFCPHYRVKTFEVLADREQVEYYFFSAGDEWYWQQQHGINSGKFTYQYVSGYRIGNTRISVNLPWKLFSNDYDVYIKCINGKFALPITYIVARIKKRPFILWTGVWNRLQTLTHKLIYPFTKFIYLNSDAIVVYGEHVKKYLVDEGVPEDRIFIANHAIDNQSYNHVIDIEEKRNLLKELEIHETEKVILYLGRLEASKGIEYLLSAFSKLKNIDNISLVVGGSGSVEEFLKQKSKELKINLKVRFPGYINRENVKYYYAISSVFVLPSVTVKTGKEPWGLVVNEAFNQGVPVIATSAVGAAAGGLVEDGINGYIVPERDSDALSIALEKILSSEVLHDYLGNNALKKISTWDNDKMVNGFIEAIDYVVSNNR